MKFSWNISIFVAAILMKNRFIFHPYQIRFDTLFNHLLFLQGGLRCFETRLLLLFFSLSFCLWINSSTNQILKVPTVIRCFVCNFHNALPHIVLSLVPLCRGQKLVCNFPLSHVQLQSSVWTLESKHFIIIFCGYFPVWCFAQTGCHGDIWDIRVVRNVAFCIFKQLSIFNGFSLLWV